MLVLCYFHIGNINEYARLEVCALSYMSSFGMCAFTSCHFCCYCYYCSICLRCTLANLFFLRQPRSNQLRILIPSHWSMVFRIENELGIYSIFTFPLLNPQLRRTEDGYFPAKQINLSGEVKFQHTRCGLPVCFLPQSNTHTRFMGYTTEHREKTRKFQILIFHTEESINWNRSLSGGSWIFFLSLVWLPGLANIWFT